MSDWLKRLWHLVWSWLQRLFERDDSLAYETWPAVYDEDGVRQTWAWLVEKYGEITIEPGGTYACAELRERGGNQAVVVTVKDKYGNPVPNLQVAWYWPDAPTDPMCGGRGQCVHGPTNGIGAIGFPMGPGAYYWPEQGQTGPHALWACGDDSDLVGGLGMLGGTDHYHLDVVLVERGGTPLPTPSASPSASPSGSASASPSCSASMGPEPPTPSASPSPSPSPEPPTDFEQAVLDYLARIEAQLRYGNLRDVVDKLEQIVKLLEDV